MPHNRVGRAITVLAAILIGLATLTPATQGPSKLPALCITCGELGGVDNVLNILLFLPLGFGVRLAGTGRWRSLFIALATTIFVEALQLTVVRGRDASVGDVTMNALGALIGIMLADLRGVVLCPAPRHARWLTVVSAAWCCSLIALGGWALRLDIPHGSYTALLAPDLTDIELFEGQVRAAAFNGSTIRNGDAVGDGVAIASLARSGNLDVRATVAPAGATFDIAPIVALGPLSQPLVIELGQRGRDLAFRIRLRASRLRLRTPSVALADAFPGSGDPEDRVLLGGMVPGSQRLRLALQSAQRDASATLELNPFLGWWLFMPFDVANMRVVGAASAFWTALLFFPLGYWGTAAVRYADGIRLAALSCMAIAASVVLGLLVIPSAFGYSQAPLEAWLGSGAGLAFGALAATVGRHAFRVNSRAQTVSTEGADGLP
jgi:VanZ family protein